jgi:hypothetical protein
VVTAKTQYSLKNAQGYFEEHLSVGDYYDQGQRGGRRMVWDGRGATGWRAVSVVMSFCGSAKASTLAPVMH